MWPLGWFHYDEGIDSAEVCLLDKTGEAELMSREEALAIARDRGLHLIPEWPEHLVTGPASCWIGKVSPPLRWEHVPEPEQAEELDPLLWFEAPCGGRDLLDGNGGTYPGRMSVWCPDKVRYNVSVAEMGQMSQQTRYYVAGFLAGNRSGPPRRPAWTPTSNPATWLPGRPPSADSAGPACGPADGAPVRPAAASSSPAPTPSAGRNTSRTPLGH